MTAQQISESLGDWNAFKEDIIWKWFLTVHVKVHPCDAKQETDFKLKVRKYFIYNKFLFSPSTGINYSHPFCLQTPPPHKKNI